MTPADDAPDTTPAGVGDGRGRRRWLRALVFGALVLLVEVSYALLAPVGTYPDELSHLQAVVHYRAMGRMPNPYAHAPEFDPTSKKHFEEKIQQDKHPPYTYVLAALVMKATEDRFAASAPFDVPGPWARQWDLARERPGSHILAQRPKVRDGQILAMRGLMIAHWLLAAFALLALADLVFRDTPRFAWAIALGFATLPQAAWGGASLTPDTPLVAFCAWTFYGLVRLACGEGRPRALGILTGISFALALMTKSAAICLVPVAIVVLWMRARRVGDARYVTLALGVPVLLLASWWYLWNWYWFGDPFQMKAQVETYTHSMRREPLYWVSFEALFWDTFRTFFGFDTRLTLLPRPLYFVFAGLAGIAVAGCALLLRRPIRSEAPARQGTGVFLSVVAVGVMLGLAVLGNLTIPSPQGRYLHPVLPGFLILAGVGFRVAMRLRTDGRVIYAIALLWAFGGVWLFGECVVARHATLRAKTPEGVLFYEDCGSPGLHPHEVQGLDAPDAGMLGRVLPARSVSGHPEAVVYRFPMARLVAARDAARAAGVLTSALQVRAVYFSPDSSTPYVAEKLGRFRYATQRLLANGRVLHEAIEVTGQPKEFVWPIEDEDLRGEHLELRFERVAGVAVSIAELWIEESWLRFEKHEDRYRITNRGPRELEGEWTFWAETANPVVVERSRHRVEAGGAVEIRMERPPELALEAKRLQLLPLQISPWSLREAEAWIVHVDGRWARWFGALDASGGYFVRRRKSLKQPDACLLARMPFEKRAPGSWILVRDCTSPIDEAWVLREVAAGQAFEKDFFEYRLERGYANTRSLDYAMLVGGWRRSRD